MSTGQPTPCTIEDWMEDIKRGRIALPRFQREFVWKDDTISDLILAIIKEKPVGALLAINYHKNCQTFRPLAIRGADRHFDESKYEEYGGMMILDGQQRLTAIWCALNDVFSKDEKNNRRKREFFMEINVEKIDLGYQQFVESVICEKINDTNKKRDNYNKCPLGGKKILVPVKLLHKEERHTIMEWVGKIYDNSEMSRKIHQRILDCNIGFNQRDISFYTLPEKMEVGEMIETFIKINTSSSKMSTFDIAVAYIEDINIKDSNEIRFRDWIDEISIDQQRMDKFFSPKNRISEIGELILKVACLLTKENENGRSYVPTERNYIKKKTISTVINRWDDIVRGIDETLEFLEAEGIYDAKRLPSEVPLRVLPALYADFPKKIDPDRDFNRTQLIQKYLWRSFFTTRYNSAAETHLHQDYMKLYESIGKIQEINDFVPCAAPIFDENIYTIPSQETLSTLRSPLKKPTTKSKLSRALLVLSLKKGAKDIASNDKISPSNIGLRQYHHLFPQKMLKNEGMDVNKINHPLNFALIQENSNKKIAAKNPKEYLLQRQVGNTKESDIRKRVESHLIPYDELNVETGENENYERFIKKRAELFYNALRELFEGKDWPE